MKILVNLLILFTVSLRGSAAQNLLCNGDFQNYYLPPEPPNPILLGFNFFSADECWYFKGQTMMEIQHPIYAYNSQMAQMQVNADRYYLCQNKTLQIGNLYNFSFQFGLNPQAQNISVNLTVNGNIQKIVTATKAGLYPNLGKLQYIFVSDQSFYEFCAGCQDTQIPGSTGGWATLVDNFQLHLIPKISKILTFSYQFDESVGVIYLVCLNETEEWYASAFNEEGNFQYGSVRSSHLNFYVEDEKVNANFSMTKYDENDVMTLLMPSAYRYQNTLYDFSFIFSYKKFEHSKFVSILDAIETMSQPIRFVFENYSIVRLLGGTSLLKDFVMITNLFTLYCYMNLSTLPKFSYDILVKLSKLYFDDVEYFNYWISTIFGKQLKQNFESISSTFQQQQYQQKVGQSLQKDNKIYEWFGSANITSQFINNNMTDIFIILLLVFKFLLLIIICKLIEYFYMSFKSKTKYVVKLFQEHLLVQLIMCSPGVSISAISLFFQTGTSGPKSQVNLLIQIFCFGIVLVLPALYFVLLVLKIKKAKSNKKKIKVFWNEASTYMHYLLHIIIPCFVALSNNISFSVFTTFSLLIIVYLFVKGFQFYGFYKKIFLFVSIVLFATHHCSFMFMFICAQENANSTSLQNAFDYLGLIVLFTLIMGVFGSLLQTFVDFCVSILYPMFTYLFCKKKVSKKEKKENKRILKNMKKNFHKGNFISVEIIVKNGSLKNYKLRIQQNTD